VRWYERPTAAATAAVDDDGDDGSQRFEFVLERYWTDVTEMSLQCALTVCNKMPASYDHKFHVCTFVRGPFKKFYNLA